MTGVVTGHTVAGRRVTRLMLWVCVCAGCRSEAPAAVAEAKSEAKSETKSETKPEPQSGSSGGESDAPAADTPGAIILDGKGLQRLTSDGNKTPIVATTFAECEVDDGNRVVWLASETKLAFYDRVDAKLVEVATIPPMPEPDTHAWQIQRRDASGMVRPIVGTADGLEDCVALVLELGKDPKVGGGTVSEGDRDWYCFEDDTIGTDKPVLVEEAKALSDHYDRAKLVDKAALVALDKRAASTSTKPSERPAPPAPPVVEVDKDRCNDDPDACGTLEYAGGGRLWWVTTENDRGDFFYESRELYDATTKRWWLPENDTWSETLPTEHDSPGGLLDPSPDGTWGLFGEKIVTLTEPKVTGSYTGTFCGWELSPAGAARPAAPG